MNELDLFSAVIGIADPSERTAFLDRHCADKPELRQRLAQLLDAHFNSNRLLDPTNLNPLREQVDALKVTSDFSNKDELAGTVIAGKYTLIELVGEGGMGSVWRAKQSEPVKRFVAVKLIKAGMDSKQVLARFNAERQALAMMDHPNISMVLDGGLHEQRPFFVMELVKGVPITEYCDKCKLTPKQRLELFVPVCQAIQHAHQKGIIHRDIKPSNVLIALYDDKAVVKVIDFGVAKATGGALTEASIDTAMGAVVGTPQYMSPEQATLNNLDIDTRSDLYALGVLLYELLTGSPPFSTRDLEKRGLLEMLRVVREEEPPRPSTKLSTADALPSISANRGTEPKKLTGLLRNELDWIVMKALEKDRARRYETANGFAADVQRYLGGEAVQAHPPSTAYRMKKFVRRNKGQVIAASLVFFALLAGIVGTTIGLFEAKRQEGIARNEAEAKELARAAEAEQRGVAETNERKAVAAAEAERIAKQDAETKRSEAETQTRRAEAGEKLAGERLAQVQAEKKKAEEEKAIAVAVKGFLQNKLLGQANVTAQANSLLRAGGLVAEAKTNPTIRELLDRAAEELSEAKIEANFPNQPLLQAGILSTVGSTYVGIGEADRAIGFLQRSLALSKQHLSPDHPHTLASMASLALGYLEAGKLDKALPLFEETLKLRKTTLGADSPDTLASMANLASGYLTARKLGLALPLLEETLKLRKATLGADDPNTLSSMNDLAIGYMAAEELDKALLLGSETFELMKTKLGADHPNTLRSMNNLAWYYVAAGKLDKAQQLLEETLKLQIPKLGADHPSTLNTMNSLAGGYWSAKRLDKSVPLFEQLLPLLEKKRGRGHPRTLLTMANLGVNYKDAGRVAEAIPLLEEAYRASKTDPDYWQAGVPLLDAYLKAGKSAEADRLLGELLADVRKQLPKDSPQLAGQLSSIGLSLLEAKAFTEAEPLLRECLTIRENTLPDLWKTFNTQSVLGGALLGQKKYAEAEPLLLKGYEGMKAREKTIPPLSATRIPEALDRLIELYTATNKPDEVTKWREERSKYPAPAEKSPMPPETK